MQIKTVDRFLARFTEEFYDMAPIEELTKFGLQGLVARSQDLLSFVKQRSPNQISISIEKGEQDNVIIKIVSDNKPFIVDSITGAIARIGGILTELYHPILYINRDEKGNLLDIKKHAESNYQAESLLYIALKDKYSEDLGIRIEQENKRYFQCAGSGS